MKSQKIKLTVKKSRFPMTDEELRKYYEQVKNSARVFRNRKKYRREEKYKLTDSEN